MRLHNNRAAKLCLSSCLPTFGLHVHNVNGSSKLQEIEEGKLLPSSFCVWKDSDKLLLGEQSVELGRGNRDTLPGKGNRTGLGRATQSCGRQRSTEAAGCEVIGGVPTTLRVKGQKEWSEVEAGSSSLSQKRNNDVGS